jgi:hypothetical protein
MAQLLEAGAFGRLHAPDRQPQELE